MPHLTTKRPAEILLVEDDEGDAILTEKALSAGQVPFVLHHAESGEEALEYLADPDKKRPDLILLDLNLPGLQGGDVLHQCKTHLSWRRIPIVILTSSRSESDILRSYDLHANTYMVKPGTPEIFERVAQTFGDYWFNSSLLAEK